MFIRFWQLLTDPAVFREWADRVRPAHYVKAAIIAFGALMGTGVITLDALGEQFGAFGWCLGWGAIAFQALIPTGDNTVKALPKALGELDDRTLLAMHDRIQAVLDGRK
ncbi:MAG TPA: hypothetical protein VJ598_05920 [Albitalea sp.]|nr:hypothetical protein [Albitalea sp.]